MVVAFVVLAAIPAVADDSDAANTYYVDNSITTTSGTTYKSLNDLFSGASISDGDVIILKSDLAASNETLDDGQYSLSKAVTIRSEGAAKKIGFGFNVNGLTTGTLKFDNVVFEPAVNTPAIESIWNNSIRGASVEIDGCTFIVKSDDTVEKTPGIKLFKMTDVSVKNSTFTTAAGSAERTIAMQFQWMNNVTIEDNEATGFFRFATTHQVANSVVIEDNTSKMMTGSYNYNGKYMDNKFVQIANDASGITESVSVTGNTVKAKDGTISVPYVNTHDSQASVKNLVVDKGLEIRGALTVSETAKVDGPIKMESLEAESSTPAITISNDASFIVEDSLVADASSTITNRGSFYNNGTVTMKKSSDAFTNSGTFYAGADSVANAKGLDAFTNVIGTGTVNGKKSTTTEVTAGNFADLKNMLDAGIPTIKAAGNPTLKENIVIKSGTTLSITGNYIDIGTYTISVNGGTINGKIKSGSATDIVNFDNVTGDFTIFKGNSIDIDATKIQGTVTVEGGAAEISGKITGDLTITTTDASDIVKFSDVTVNSGVKLTLSGPGQFNVVAGKTFNLYGSLVNGNAVASSATSPAPIEIDVKKVGEAKATFKAYSGSQIAGTILIKGEGTIDLSKAQNPQTVGEDISYDKTYGQLENVTIVGNLTIKNNSTVTVKGGFQVNEGVTLTIEKGSELVIDSSAASMIVAGRIIVEEGATLKVENAKDVQVSGSIESEGAFSVDSNVTVKSGGSISINDGTVAKATAAITTVAGVKELYSSVFEPKKGLVVEAGATLTVRSLMYSVTAMNIDNKGTVVFDKAVIGGDVNVNMLADGAVVEVISIENIAAGIDASNKATGWSSNTLTITDDGLVFANKEKVGTAYATSNSVKVKAQGYAFKGLTVVEKVSSYTDDAGEKQYLNTLDIAGGVSVSKVEEISGATYLLEFSIDGDRIAVTGELALGKNVVLTVSDKKLSVSGTLVATEEGSSIVNRGEVSVSGLVQVLNNADIGTINAAMYESKIGTTTIYNYTTLKAAVDSGSKDITVTGTVYVSETLTVPAGVTVKNNGTIVVGSDDSTDVSLTFADGASVKYGTVEVMGTLVFDNKKDNKASEINSDVSVIGDVSAKYTNLFTALSEAQAGDTVTVDREIVELKKSITIKEGVTLDLPSSKVLKVFAGVTITVNGTLRTAEKIQTDAGVTFDLAADKLNSKAAIIVNGVFMSMDPVQYDGAVTKYMIPGAYYSLSDSVGAYNYVTTLENASKSDAVAVSVYGKVSAGDIAFTGTETAPKTVTVAVGADLTVASIALDKADLTVAGRISGDVKVGDSAVSVKNVGIGVSIDKDGHMVVETVSKNVTGTETASFKVSAGSIHIRSASMDVTVASGATLASDSEPTTVDGKLTIEGTVSVANEQTITVKKDVVVKGTLSVADATDSKIAGTFKVEAKLYIGLTSKDVKATADAASVSGAIDGVSVAFVKADATVSDATLESFKNAEGKLVSTTYVVEDKDWMTVYDRIGSYTIGSVTNAPVTDAEFNGWKNTKGDDVGITATIGSKDCDKVTADIKYDIYWIYITPCAGIESIAIDGNLIQTSNLSSAGGLSVKAGAHTITYSLANGYSGEAKLSMVKSGDKTAASVSGMTFTVSGGAGDVYLQLTGIEKSGYVDPTPVTPSDDGKDGLSLTDYLLIVLVVLIVIMAVIVAMRLMRS